MSRVGFILRAGFEHTRSVLMQGNPKSKGGALADMTGDFNAASMCANNSLNDHQTEAGAFFLGGEKRFEDSIDLILGNAATRVRYRHPDPFKTFASLEGKAPSRGHGL